MVPPMLHSDATASSQQSVLVLQVQSPPEQPSQPPHATTSG
jgi:hypothetical protein